MLELCSLKVHRIIYSGTKVLKTLSVCRLVSDLFSVVLILKQMFFKKFLIRILLNIEKYTTFEGKRQGNNNFVFSVGQLKTFFGWCIIRGMVKGQDELLYSFLENSYGRKIFSAKIARNKFKLVLWYIRFNNKAAERQWRGTDKFEAIRELWKCHVELAESTFASCEGNNSQTGFCVFLNVFLYSTCLNSKHVTNMFYVFNAKHAMFRIIFWMI